jgi:ectoine hydroxylase-related dioxygenase (phytanoyl-CoA dioxygenase family)
MPTRMVQLGEDNVSIAEQATFFETFGYLVLRRAFSSDEMISITTEFDLEMAEGRQGRPFEGDNRQIVYALVEKRLPWVLTDDRIFGTVERMLGANFTWIASDSNLYVGDTSWHPDNDRTDLDYETLKVALYLDPVDRDTGCLRVIPGSHRPALHEDLRPLREEKDVERSPFGIPQRRIPSVALVSEPGDVVIFNHRTYHASFGGAVGRRMLTMNFGAEPTTVAAKDHLRWIYEFNLNWQRKVKGRDEVGIYDGDFLRSPHPRLQQLAQHIVEMRMK